MSDYMTLQPRTMQAVERVMSDFPAAGRVDPTIFFLVTPDRNALSWMQNHNLLNPQTRIPVIFHFDDVRNRASDDYLVRRAISEQLYSRDLFNDQLPLRTDQFFVGRDEIVAEALSALKQAQNRGLFGLRKTGKTSILFKIRRIAERDGVRVIYLDCKDPAIRNLHWQELLLRIIGQIRVSKHKKDTSEHVSDQFKNALRESKGKNTCIIFDEIEYISPITKADAHWSSEFTDFWQTLWTAQSELRNVSFIIAGVNPTIVESDRFNGMQNPVFSIVTQQYITGLTERDVDSLVKYIGPWMGLSFDRDASKYMHERYGGHPLLTRMACSHLHIYLNKTRAKRPVNISRQLLKLTEANRDDDIAQYSRHVVSELSEFYPIEYELLEMLAAGNIAEFIDFASGSDYTRHLDGYGLVENSKSTNPSIKIPLIKTFLNKARAHRLSLSMGPQIVKENHRPDWLRDRVSRITTDVRTMERAARSKNLPTLYGRNGFPEAERFHAIGVCNDPTSYDSFVNVINRCFVEPIEAFGNDSKRKDYFWLDIKREYPYYWPALLRAKLYRHNEMHLRLKTNVENQLNEILSEDFLSTLPEETGCPHFALQQMILDGLFVGIQQELERLT